MSHILNVFDLNVSLYQKSKKSFIQKSKNDKLSGRLFPTELKVYSFGARKCFYVILCK